MLYIYYIYIYIYIYIIYIYYIYSKNGKETCKTFIKAFYVILVLNDLQSSSWQSFHPDPFNSEYCQDDKKFCVTWNLDFLFFETNIISSSTLTVWSALKVFSKSTCTVTRDIVLIFICRCCSCLCTRYWNFTEDLVLQNHRQ